MERVLEYFFVWQTGSNLIKLDFQSMKAWIPKCLTVLGPYKAQTNTSKTNRKLLLATLLLPPARMLHPLAATNGCACSILENSSLLKWYIFLRLMSLVETLSIAFFIIIIISLMVLTCDHMISTSFI